ncbi:biotin/lipoyl-containing protein [Herpetosiphon sp.]|uniref:Dihydrolipoamide acetyltransferase component of pyruvate dehydrogenase complex n=1 Tax=Herpetosiphon aurantiacus (strain ATCC 23779 / DSM 785 / 114-95) TaxID=316274 RepID=A9B1X1_HERA2|nr:biotin/lipoyl-containing protein [Herpetosiphon sp.]ABX05413.1 E3 binding domain protein [Herpetosiphon aurantiacus DSM 785]
MASSVALPTFQSTARLYRWLIQPGAEVAAGQLVALVVDAHAEWALPAQQTGTVAALLVDEGATLDVTTPLLQFVEMVSKRQLTVTPLARCIAERHQLDLSTISGTLADGRVGKRDILAHLPDVSPTLAEPTEQLAAPADGFCVAEQMGNAFAQSEQVIVVAAPKNPPISQTTPPQASTLQPWTEAQLQQIQLRQLAAASIPQAYCSHAISLDRFASTELTAHLLLATIQVLQRHPLLRSVWSAGDRLERASLHIQVEHPLGRCSIPFAADLNLRGLQRALTSPATEQAGVFSFIQSAVNLWSAAPINYGQSATLHIGATRKVLVGEALQISQQAIATLSYDTRLISDAAAEAFLADLAKALA